MVAADARRPLAVPKKRKTAPASDANRGPPKKSPLFNQPQNFYAPPAISSMTKAELSEWRKEERRKRNRESAAASRNKTRARIDELEGEVNRWKDAYAAMENRMRCMERHIEFLTRMNNSLQAKQGGIAAVNPPSIIVSPNSPPMSPKPIHAAMGVMPNAVTSSSIYSPPPPYSSHVVPSNPPNPFPAILSEPRDCSQVEKKEAVAVSPAMPEMSFVKEPREHLTPIPRQAVKITGAPSDSPVDSQDGEQRQRLPGLPAHDPQVENKEEGEGVGSVGNAVTISEEASAKTEGAPFEHSELDLAKQGDVSSLESPSSDDDEDFLDLLVDTLDGAFDPDLLI